MTFYNDSDPQACAWLRELIEMGELPDGRVDERSITDVRAEDIGDVAHFFAGIGGWPYALELAGWNATRPVWTASLPCQPFSIAGRGRGHEDERHLWPVFYDLVRECRPPIILGEQVASKAGRVWLAAVQADLEVLGYRAGAADLCAAGIGAPHIRQRLYWAGIRRERKSARLGISGHAYSGVRLADTGSAGLAQRQKQPARDQRTIAERGSDAGGLAYNHSQRQPQRTQRDGGTCEPGQCAPCGDDVVRCGGDGGLPYAQRHRLDGTWAAWKTRRGELADMRVGNWSDVIWVPCADGKVRPLEPGLEPLVDGLPVELVRGGDQRLAPQRSAEARTMRLRGFGNAIVPQLAAVFVQTVMEYLDATPQQPA